MADINPLDPNAAQLMDLSQQRKLADLLTQQGLQAPQGQMVSGQYVKSSPLQYFANMANLYAGQKTGEQATQKATDYANALRQQKADAYTQYQELISNPETRGQAMKFAAGNEYLQPMAAELMKGMKLGEGEKFVMPNLGGGAPVELASGGEKYRVPIHVDVGNAIELRDPRDPTKVLQRLPKGVSPGEAARLGFEGIPYGGGQSTGVPTSVPTGQPQGIPQSIPQGQPTSQNTSTLLPPLNLVGLSPKAAQEAKAEYAKNIQENVNNAYQVYKVAGDIEKTLPNAHGSGIGNMMGGVANFVGYESSKNAADADLKVMSDKLLKAVPRFSGPQSDKDVQSYKEAAGSIGDAGLPMNVRLSALNRIKELNKPYAPNLNWESQVPKQEQTQKVSLGAAPMYATNGSTRIMSTDGGKTWQPAR